MLLCHLSEIDPGATLAASVFHPERPELELLGPGKVLDAKLLERLRSLHVESAWIVDATTEDLDQLIDPALGQARREVLQQLSGDFSSMAGQVLSTAHVLRYRQIMQEMILELTSHRRVAHMAGQMLQGPTGLFTHSANVAYMSTIIGLAAERYIIQQRPRLDADQARDLSSLGVGAILHDIGKLQAEPPQSDGILEWEEESEAQSPYRDHPVVGYRMLEQANCPASARQVVLNHHQRWDGQGFPDMSVATNQRRQGAQSGEGIHVFSRIVAVADVLDHLLQGGSEQQRPPIMALGELASSRFSGWFDPVIQQAALRSLPPFAIGSRVVLSDGRPAAVVAPNVHQPCRPSVRLLDEASRLPDGQPSSLNLQDHPGLRITHCAGQEVEPYLFTLPDPRAQKKQGPLQTST